MSTAYVAATTVAIAANTFPGVSALKYFEPTLPAMATTGVLESWLTMIGAVETAPAAGLLLGLFGVPLFGIGPAIILIMFFVSAISGHSRSRGNSRRLGLAIGFLFLTIVTLVLNAAVR